MAKSAVRSIAGIFLAAWGVTGVAGAAPSGPRPYIDHIAIYTLGFIVTQSQNIAVLQVDKVSRDKRVILFRKSADLKGTFPGEECRIQVTDGFRSHESHLVL